MFFACSTLDVLLSGGRNVTDVMSFRMGLKLNSCSGGELMLLFLRI